MFALSSVFGTPVQAQDYLTFRLQDGTERSLPVDGLKITFGDKTLHAVAQETAADFQLADLTLMFFAETPTAVETVADAAGQVAIVDGRLVVNAPVGTVVRIYTPDGRRVPEDRLLRGMYLVKVNDKTYKMMAR